jgi:hypothetical protein
MKLSFVLGLASVVFAAALAAIPASSQTPQNTGEQSVPNSSPNSAVLFSRSVDENGKTTTTIGSAAQPAPKLAADPVATDSHRLAVAFSSLDLEVHLQTEAHRIAVRARITLRNDGKMPLKLIPLQISSSLNWEQIRIEGRNVSFPVAMLNSDADHTGQLQEAAVPLAEPLAPGATLQLDALYSGTIELTAKRLTAIGAPENVALHSDWDEISPDFTGLRGFGNVVWYPVSSVPVILGDGSRLFDEIGRHKLSLARTHMRVSLIDEFAHDEPPTIALIDGAAVPLAIADSQQTESSGVAGVATASFETQADGFLAPSLFVASRKAHPGPNLDAFSTPENDITQQSWLDEAAVVTPFLQEWLGRQSRCRLTLLDLPDADDMPFETGALLVTSLHTGPVDQIDSALAHALTHAYAQSIANPVPAWLNEGLATFLESLWIEKHRGRDRALAMLDSDRSALALAEPSSPGESSGSPLAVAIAPVYYRTKAAYVFWMLRDLTGDEALSTALHSWVTDGTGDKPAAALQSLLKQAGVKRDLSWFFSDWIDADKGLPDLAIESVFPNAAQAGTYLVAVSVANTGYAAAYVPVTVRTAKSSVTEHFLVPARGRAVERVVVVGPPTQVQLNDGTIPETQASVHVTDFDATTTNGPQSDHATAGNSSSSSNQPTQPR